MKALLFDQAGTPEDVLTIRDVEKPIPAPDEVLVRISGSPINPADGFFINGHYRLAPEFPQIAGLEGAGIVEATGKDVPASSGRLVAFSTPGSWAEYVAVPWKSVIPLEDDFPLQKAAQFYLNPFTAWCLLEESKIGPGGWLLVNAASSTVSGIVIQLARKRGIRVIAVVRDLEGEPGLRSLGVEAVLDQAGEDFEERIMELTGGAGVNAALDAVGGNTGTKTLTCMAAGGSVVVYGLLSKDPVSFYNAQIIYRNLSVTGFGIRSALTDQTPDARENMIRTLKQEIIKPSFQLPVSESFPLENFREALQTDRERKRKGKVIFRP